MTGRMASSNDTRRRPTQATKAYVARAERQEAEPDGNRPGNQRQEDREPTARRGDMANWTTVASRPSVRNMAIWPAT